MSPEEHIVPDKRIRFLLQILRPKCWRLGRESRGVHCGRDHTELPLILANRWWQLGRPALAWPTFGQDEVSFPLACCMCILLSREQYMSPNLHSAFHVRFITMHVSPNPRQRVSYVIVWVLYRVLYSTRRTSLVAFECVLVLQDIHGVITTDPPDSLPRCSNGYYDQNVCHLKDFQPGSHA